MWWSFGSGLLADWCLITWTLWQYLDYGDCDSVASGSTFVAANDLAGGGGGKQRRAGSRADRAGAIYPEFQFAASAGLLSIRVSTRRRGIRRGRIVCSFRYELFAVSIADRSGVFRCSGLSRVAGGGSVGLPDCRRLVRRGAGGGLHRIAPAVGGQYSGQEFYMSKSNIDLFVVTSFLCSLKFVLFHRIEYPKRCLYKN